MDIPYLTRMEKYGIYYLGSIYIYFILVILVISLWKLYVLYAKFMKEELQNRRVYFRIMDLSLVPYVKSILNLYLHLSMRVLEIISINLVLKWCESHSIYVFILCYPALL